MVVMIIDYGMGNLFSVKQAFEKCGATVSIVNNPTKIKDASHIVLPGVGAFKDGMDNIRDGNWEPYIREAVYEHKIPLLGICLGMQLLANRGYEVEKTKGLGLISGEVIKFKNTEFHEKIPHVGWNEIEIAQNTSLLLEGISDKTDYYFVHSYYFKTEENNTVLAKTPYCGEFASIIGKELVFGVQFHPEKSQSAGFKLIRNFLNI